MSVSCKKSLNLSEHFSSPQLAKPVQHKSILSDRLKRIWPLWLFVDHQKIVFTTTLSATLTLTNATPSVVVWSQKYARAEAGFGISRPHNQHALLHVLPGSHVAGIP